MDIKFPLPQCIIDVHVTQKLYREHASNILTSTASFILNSTLYCICN